MKKRPYVFIGSSAESLAVAQAIQANLDHTCECQIWTQGTFAPGGSFEDLASSAKQFDFGVFVLAGDDLTQSRGSVECSPRDNVLFELGFFAGALGLDRVFRLQDRHIKLKVPSDLAGIAPATFEKPNSGTWQSAVGPACSEIERQMQKLGPRRSTVRAWWWTKWCSDSLRENPDYFMTVANYSPFDLPWLNVHVFPSNTFQLEPITERTERLMSDQLAIYRFRMVEEGGHLTSWAKRFAETKPGELSINIFKNNAALLNPLLVDHDLGAALFNRIQKYRSVGLLAE